MNSTEIAIKVETLSQVKKKINFDVPWDDVKREMDDVYRQIGKSAKIKGFRNGKVPRKILESFYKERAESETITNIVNKYYWDAIKEYDIDAVTQPEIDQNGIEENKNFSFTATIETEPVIDPQGYIGLKIEKVEYKVTDEDTEARLQEIRTMFATLEDISDDREILEGDAAVIDFQGSLDGNALDDVKAENYVLEIGSHKFVPGFEEQLIGMKKGETKEIDVLFPQDYQSKTIAGKNIHFHITLKGIKEKKLPEVDENFIKNFDRFDSLDALQNEIRMSLEDEAKKKSQSLIKTQMIEKLLEINDLEVPPSFLERQIYYMMSDMQRRMMSGGMDSKNATELTLKMHDQFKEEAEKIVKSALLLKNIAKKESINLSEQEIDDRIREIADSNKRDFETLKKSFEQDDSRGTLENDVLSEKIFKYLEEKADIVIAEKRFTDSTEDK
ncbi:MAG: trigger factor [Syntrophaceae bacterium]|nr:trigger factor [Syntrophaceae bacterium]